MKNSKKLISVSLLVLMLGLVTACGNRNANNADNNAGTEPVQTPPEPTARRATPTEQETLPEQTRLERMATPPLEMQLTIIRREPPMTPTTTSMM